MPGASEFDSYAETYRDAVERSIAFSGADHEFFTRAKARELLRIAARRLGDPRELAVLDVGCGPGETDQMLTGEIGRLAGVDTSTAMVDVARERNPWADYRVSEAGGPLPFDDHSFDLAFAICVLHHVAPPQRPPLIAEVTRVTKPGGAVVVFEHNPLNPLTRRAVAGCEFDHDAVLLGRRESERLLARAGLRDPEGAYIVFFTRRSARLEWIERRLGRLPLGAQYVVSARRG
jgi:SAM-dependent methyltransferase